MQATETVSSNDRVVGQSGYASDRRIHVEANGLGAGGCVPQPDRVVARSRGEPAVQQHAQPGDMIRVALEAAGLGSGGRVPQPDRVVPGA